MAPASNIYRRPSGVYAVRLVVPERLRRIVGKREVHISTGTRTLPLAKAVAAGVLAHWRVKFFDLERLKHMDLERLLAGTPALLTEGHLPLREAGAVTGLEESELLRLAVDGRLALFFRPMGLDGHFVPYEDMDLDSWESNIYDVPLPNFMPSSAIAGTAPPMLALRQSRGMASHFLDSAQADVVLFAIPGCDDVAFATGKITIH